MSTELRIHPASESERLQAYRNVHEVWNGGLSLDEHVERRLKSIQHNRAQWFVGCVNDKVVTSLGTYPLRFRLDDRIVSGIAIGAVHTVAEFRGQGFAPQLIGSVEQYHQARSVEISLLYSDIKPSYYARLGYVQCDGWDRWFGVSDTESTPADAVAPRLRLQRACRSEALRELSRIHDAFHEGMCFSIARDADYWNYLLTKNLDDEFYWLRDSTDSNIGYVRLGFRGPQAVIRDLALQPPINENATLLIDSLSQLARERAIERWGGWLPISSWVNDEYSRKVRLREVTMLKSLCAGIRIDEEVIRDCQHLHEIDHV